MPFEWDVKVSSKVSPVATLVFQRAGLSRARYTTVTLGEWSRCGRVAR